MRKLKKPLLIVTGALILITAAVFGVLSLVKTTPWELTYHIVPSDVTSVLLWKGTQTAQLTEDEIVSIVHLLNHLDKSSFTIKYGHTGPQPAFGLIIRCGDLKIMINQSTTSHGTLVMTFDQMTSETFMSGQWYLNSDELKAYIDTLLDAKAAELTQE